MRILSTGSADGLTPAAFQSLPTSGDDDNVVVHGWDHDRAAGPRTPVNDEADHSAALGEGNAVGNPDGRRPDDRGPDMCEATAPPAPRRVHVSRVVLAGSVAILLAGCAPLPGTTRAPVESAGTTSMARPTGEGTELPGRGLAGESQRTSDEIVADVLTTVQDLMTYSSGEYTYVDGTPFDPADTAGYPGEGCTGQQGRSITVDVSGPPAADIDAVEQEVVDTYTARGWNVILREETALPEGRIMDVSFADPSGKQFGFGLGPHATTITMSSECSTHPSLDEPST
jgi:hypothetical protein